MLTVRLTSAEVLSLIRFSVVWIVQARAPEQAAADSKGGQAL